MNTDAFLVEKIDYEFEATGRSTVTLIGPDADKKSTHISLIVGANGTSKSRMLASLVEQFCEIHEQRNLEEPSRRFSAEGAHGVRCIGLSTLSNGLATRFDRERIDSSEIMEHLALPSTILALSNLVMDKFHFPKGDAIEVGFYQYLGVRQATNLTTTGSLERAVTEAVFSMAGDRARLSSFQSWIELLFGGSRELALMFPRSRHSDILKFLEIKDKNEFILERMQRRAGPARATSITPELVEEITAKVTELFEFIKGKVEYYEQRKKSGRKQVDFLLRFSELNDNDKLRLPQMAQNFSAAQGVGFSVWPSFLFEAAPWLSFNQLSSGEQNILSVGAKLIAYSKPGCLIAIDEPEVSLNVKWQQHYTTLIQKSLFHAPGSHVLIATHSPHLIASVPAGKASVVLVEKEAERLSFKTMDATFEGWGAESVLYQVLGIPSASSYLFNKELAKVLAHLQDGGVDKILIDAFLDTAMKLDFDGIEPLEEVVAEVKSYRESLN